MSVLSEWKNDGLLTAEQYLAFLETRPDDERWELIDGVAVMMNPPTYRHQNIERNILRLLEDALEHTRPELTVVSGGGILVEGYPRFRPQPDIVVVDRDLDEISYADRFYLAAEILSQSNTPEFIALKVERYKQNPHNLYTFVVAQRELRVDVMSRANDWLSVVLSSPDDVLELPEFGFRCAVRELYRGTPLA
ncbi:MAG TPA: Uma2 family endonuclease [Afifellaceae bacterium]|nr:Uma2 family endonuclease [Afifellaceae bacterium]